MATTTVTSGRKTIKETLNVADNFNISGDATSVTIAGKMKAGDIINIEGLASDYLVSAAGRTVTLKSDTQTIKFQLDSTAGSASVRFFDGDLTASYTAKGGALLGTQKLTRKAADVNDENLGANDSSAVSYGSSSSGSTGGSTGTSSVPFTLTTGTNRFTGGSGDDTFDGGLSTGSLQTLNSGDQLDGGTGTDELFAVVNSSVTPSKLTSIENVSLTNITTASEVNFGNATDLQKVTNQGSTVGLTISGVGTGVRVDVTDTATAAQVVTYSSVTGTADSATIGVSNVSGAATVSVLGIETLNIVSGGTTASTIATLTTDTATRLNVSGSQGLTITNNTIAPVNYVDASANTASGAGVDIDLAVGAVTVIGGTGNDSFEFNVAGNVTATGGAGNDTFDFTGTTNTFTVADSVAGGVGTADIIIADHDDIAGITSPMTATTGGTVTGVERLYLSGFTDDATARSITLSNISSEINHVRINSVTGGTDNTLTVNYGAGASTLSFNVAAAITAGDTLVLDAAGTGTSDSLAIVNSRTTTDDIGSTTSNITTTDFETVSIDTGSYAVAVAQNLGAVNAGSTTAVNVSGGNNLVLAAGLVAASINASNLGGAAILSMGAATTIGSITGGANNDVLVGDTSSSINGGAGDDTVTGGSGNDTLIGGAGADTITNSGGASDSVDGGDGNDTVVATLTAGNTIVGGAGTDTLSIAVAATAATATAVSGFETLTDTAGVTQSMSLFLDNNTFTKVVAGNTNTTAITGATGTLTALDVTAAGTTTFARLVDSSANALTVTVTGGVTATAITASDEETITLASSNSSAAIVTALTATDLQTLNITGSGAVTITTLNANTTASSSATFVVNGSTNSAGVNVSAANSTIVANMTGSSTASSTLVGSSGSDVITGGAAADSITGGIGYDTLTGGAGADSFLFANSATGTPSATGNAFDIIADYQSGIDIIEAGTVFGTGAGAIVLLQSPNTTHAGGVAQAGKAWVASGVVSFHISDNTLALRLIAVENAIADLNADGTAADAAAGDALVFGFGSDSYVFISDGTAGVGTTDVLIRLTGIAASSSTDSLTIADGNITALA
jgi:hypothetical protein